MYKLQTILIALLFFSFGSIKAQSYHVSTPGTLKELVGEEASSLTSIRLTGTLNKADLDFLRSLATYPDDVNILRSIDMEDADIVDNTIHREAFFISYIESYKLPKTLKRIEEDAFQNNHNLKELIIPEGVIHVGKRSIFCNRKLERVIFPESLLELGESVLGGGNHALKEVQFSSKLEVIGDVAFNMCENLSFSQPLPPTLKKIGSSAFSGTLLKEVTVPSGVKEMEGAFWGCKDLEKVVFEAPRDKIERYAFYWCEALKEVELPEGITHIGESAFFWNLKLSKITLPESLTHIEDDAFNSDPFETIIIPSNVVLIGREAFWNNRNLRQVYAKPIVPPVTSAPTNVAPRLPFANCDEETCTLYVPKGTAEAYRASEVFAAFGKIVELEPWEFPTSNDNILVHDNSIKVYTANAVLVIESDGTPMDYIIYSIDGRIAKKGLLDSSQTRISLAKGFYIIQIGKRSYKVTI